MPARQDLLRQPPRSALSARGWRRLATADGLATAVGAAVAFVALAVHRYNLQQCLFETGPLEQPGVCHLQRVTAAHHVKDDCAAGCTGLCVFWVAPELSHAQPQ